MKSTFLAFFVSFVVFQSVYCKPPENKAVSDCFKELDIPPAVLDYFDQNGKIEDESSKKAKCFFKCVPEKAGVSNADGSLNHQKFTDFSAAFHPGVDKSKIQSSIQKCDAETSDSDACERMYKVAQCQYKNVKA